MEISGGRMDAGVLADRDSSQDHQLVAQALDACFTSDGPVFLASRERWQEGLRRDPELQSFQE